MFDKCLYSDKEFRSIIENNVYYLVFANIQLCPKNSKSIKIQNYSQFMKSDCRLILFITDNEFVDIYVKEDLDMDTIYSNAVNSGFSNIRCMKNHKDARKKFSAFSD